MSENEPNSSNNENSNEQTSVKNQTELSSELNGVLTQIAGKLDRITAAVKTQSEFVNSIVSSFDLINDFTNDMTKNASKMSEALEETIEKIHENFNKKKFEELQEGLESVSKAAQNTVNTQNEGLQEVSDNLQQTSDMSKAVSATHEQASKKMSSNLSQKSLSLTGFYKTSKTAYNELGTFSNELSQTTQEMTSLTSGFLGTVQKYAGAVIQGGLNLISFLTSAIGNMLKFAKHAVTLPFTIAKAASQMGYKIRSEVAQIKEAGEDLKQSFDFESSVGQGIQSLVSRGAGMLKSFQSPSNELVKIFGLGSSGITNMIKFLGENIAAMGHFSEVFGESILKNEGRMKNFIRLVKGLGFSSEDVKYISLDASNNLKHVNIRMTEIVQAVSTASTEFQVDRKRLSKNFMIMRKDIVQFGHLSDEEISRTTARLTQMRVNLEDAAAVFKKFSTFEDAANSVAMLSQTFGMNLDAMDIIKAKNPKDIIEMFRDSMLETGRSYQDLNRFEKEIMAQHTGISEKSLSAIMNFRDLGLTYEQAKKRMESQKPEAKQMKAIKKLNSAIKELQKVLQFDSPFQAFFRGLTNNTYLSGDLKDTMMSLSKGYQGIYEFALNLDPNTWSGLIQPIKMIIDIMRNILQSEDFKNGLVGTLKAVSGFVADMFGATSGDTILSKIETNVRMQTGKKGFLYKDNKKNRQDFNKSIMLAVKNRDKSLSSLIDIKELEKINDPLKLIRKLSSLKNSLNKNDPRLKKFDQMLEAMSANIINKFDPLASSKLKKGQKASSQLPKSRTPAEMLASGLGDGIDNNKGNVGKLFDTSMKIAGAIIKGAIIGGTAIIKVISDQIKNYETNKAKQGNKTKNTNMLEDLLGFKPGEFNNLGEAINTAFIEFVSSLKENSGIFTWLLAGIKDVFVTLVGILGNVVIGGLKGLFGMVDEKSSGELMGSQSSMLARPSASTTRKNIEDTKLRSDNNTIFNEYTSKKDTVNMYYDLKRQIDQKSGSLSQGQQRQLQSISTSIESNLKNNKYTESELTGVAQNMSVLQLALSDNSKRLGKRINDMETSIKNLDKDKQSNKDSITSGAGEEILGGFLQGAGILGVTAGALWPIAAGVVNTSIALGAGGGILGAISAIGAGVAAAFSAPVIGTAALIAGSGYGLYKLGEWLWDNSDSADVEGIAVNDANINGMLSSNIQSIDSASSVDNKLKENMFFNTVDSDYVQKKIENNGVYATHNVEDTYKEGMKIIRPKDNKISREEYSSLMEKFALLKEEMSKPFEVDSYILIDKDLRKTMSIKNVQDGHYEYSMRPDFNIGRMSPTEFGRTTNSAGSDGAPNTPVLPNYKPDSDTLKTLPG